MQNTLLPTATDKVEEMTFEPIKGYPMLHWQGKRPFTATQYYPAQLKERYGDPVDGWMNRIYWGDNLQVMSHLLKEFRGKVDLVYIDPPFDSNAEYKKKIVKHGQLASNGYSAFEEKQYTDIWFSDSFFQFLYDRFILLKELLSPNGTIFIHIGGQSSHYVKLICDEVFGIANFRNEIILPGRAVKNLQQQFEKISSLQVRHDYLLWYSKSTDFKFAPFWVYKHDVGNIEGHWHHFWSTADRPTMRYELFGITPETGQWVWKKERALVAIENHNRFLDEAGGRTLAQYWRDTGSKLEFLRLDSESNRPQYWREPAEMRIADTVWAGVPILNNSNEYPTEKNEKLLTQVLELASNPGSIVFDCFMGSGTTQAVAMKLGRRFIGADINLGAIQTTTKRLNGIIKEKREERKSLIPENPLYLNFEVHNVNHYDVFRNPVQARDLLIQALEIDPLESTDLFDGMKDGYLVKIMPVNRIATRADLNPIISGVDYRDLERKTEQNPGAPAARIMLVCMGHEPNLAATLKMEIGTQYRVDVQVVDILRDKQDLVFKYDSEADIAIEGEYLTIKQFYPRNLLQKLSILEENVEEWRELVETVAIDWNYNGEVLRPTVYDSPGKNELVKGRYKLPPDYGQIRVKITDLLSESLEMTVEG